MRNRGRLPGDSSRMRGFGDSVEGNIPVSSEQNGCKDETCRCGEPSKRDATGGGQFDCSAGGFKDSANAVERPPSHAAAGRELSCKQRNQNERPVHLVPLSMPLRNSQPASPTDHTPQNFAHSLPGDGGMFSESLGVFFDRIISRHQSSGRCPRALLRLHDSCRSDDG
jgi:hypothetical protein